MDELHLRLQYGVESSNTCWSSSRRLQSESRLQRLRAFHTGRRNVVVGIRSENLWRGYLRHTSVEVVSYRRTILQQQYGVHDRMAIGETAPETCNILGEPLWLKKIDRGWSRVYVALQLKNHYKLHG